MKLYDIPQIDAKMYLRDETDLWGFIQNGEYEPHETELVKKIVKKDWVCLDIGANIGYYTILMSKLGAKWVHSFEPEPTNMEYLKLNVELNGLTDKVEFVKKAVLRDNPDLLGGWLYICPNSHGMHRMFQSKFCNDRITVDTCSIDTYMLGKQKPDFIKIDVEGSELGVIKSMFSVIETYHPKMLIEFHPPTIEESHRSPKELYYLLKGLGYQIELVWPNEQITNYEQLDKLTRNESGGQNIYCQ